jgi:hypothetical protein
VRSVLPALPIAWLSFLYKPLQSPIFFLIVLIAIAAIAIAAFVRRRLYEASEIRIQNRFLVTLVALFLVSLLPVINLRLSLYETLGERFLYLPTVFACVLIAHVGSLLIRKPRVALVLLTGVLGLCAWSLYRTNMIWREAAKLSRNIPADLIASASGDQILILNAPDNLRGVPVFHNGLPEAVKYFENRNQPVQIVAYQSLQSVNDQIFLIESGDALTMRSSSADVFDRVSSSQCWEVVSQSGNSVELRRRSCASVPESFYWSDGRLNKLSTSSR